MNKPAVICNFPIKTALPIGGHLLRTFLTVSLMLLVNMPQTSAQVFGNEDKISNKAKKLFQKSGNHMAWNRYQEAIQVLEQAVEISPSFIKAHERLGKVHLVQKNFHEAASTFRTIIQLDSTYSKFTYFNLAEAYFFSMKYDSADYFVKRFLQKNRIAEKKRKEANQMQANIDFAKDAVQDPVPFNPVNLGPEVNSKRPDFSPAMTADEQTLIFTRLINTRGRPQEDFYISQKQNGEWSKAQNLGSPVNTIKNQGAHTITPDGRYLIFTGCHYRDTRGRCDLYITSRKGNEFGRPANLGHPVNTGAWESQPSIAPDASTLYFASNRRDGFGGSDIWKTTYQGQGEWSEPENLGPTINTEADERAPFIHSDNQTLYFSSAGHPGMGEQDIYVSRQVNDTAWSAPKNLGYPINTPSNDNWLFVSAGGKKAYFASDREDSYGEMDLYSFKLYEEARPGEVTYVKGTVYDQTTKEKLGATIEIKNLKTGETINAIDSDQQTGEFLITLPLGREYAYIASKKGYLFHSEHFSLEDLKKKEAFHLDIPLQPIEVGSDMVLRNIFFEVDSHELKKESKVELDRLITFLSNNPGLKIEIGGHTDSTGATNYNKELSRKRAEAVYSHLVENGIDEKRLTYKGYGETKPVASNATKEGRARNRRTEATIIEK